jgi:uncharacterized delta-60 repeat protein
VSKNHRLLKNGLPRLPSLRVLALGVVAAFVVIGVAIVSGCGSGAAAAGFGTGGKVLTPMRGVDYGAAAFAIQSDGRIVATGGPFDLARYTAAGRLDGSFGRGGKVEHGWGRASATPGYGGVSRAIAIQHDGKIVLGGYVGAPYGREGHDSWADFALARYTPSGRLDPSFGKGGTVQTHFGPEHSVYYVYALAIQPDGKIVAAGSTLARYTTDGRLDPSFGSGGKVAGDRVLRGGSVSVTALAVQADGEIVAAGWWHSYKCCRVANRVYDRVFLERYTSAGKLDQSFGTGGVVWPQFTAFGGVAIQRDGKIVVVGGFAVRGAGTEPTFAVSRYSPDGHLDPSFSGDGKVRTDLPGWDAASAVAIQADGRIVVAGLSWTNDGDKGSFVVARYTEDGRLDADFGSGGSAETSLGPLSEASGVAIQRDGKIVVVGEIGGLDQRNSFALVRYTRDGHLDS